MANCGLTRWQVADRQIFMPPRIDYHKQLIFLHKTPTCRATFGCTKPCFAFAQQSSPEFSRYPRPMLNEPRTLCSFSSRQRRGRGAYRQKRVGLKARKSTAQRETKRDSTISNGGASQSPSNRQCLRSSARFAGKTGPASPGRFFFCRFAFGRQNSSSWPGLSRPSTLLP